MSTAETRPFCFLSVNQLILLMRIKNILEERDYVQHRLKESRAVHCGSSLGFSVHLPPFE